MLSRNELLWRGRDDKMVVFSIFEKVGNKEEFLLQEGYVKEPVIEQPVVGYDRKFIYPYVLYDDQKKKMDCIFYIEYCNYVVDDEYVDGRMTWEDEKTEWIRSETLCKS